MIDGDNAEIVRRLKSIEGHVRGIQRMVEENTYCMDVITQSLAVQRALERLNVLILERHLKTCVTTAIRGDDPAERERVIAEILAIFERAEVLKTPKEESNGQRYA